jgi:hypothetical protein
LNNYGQLSSGYIDGGTGTDTLSLNDSIGVDLSPSVISDQKVTNIEALFLGSTGANYAVIGSAGGAVTWGIASVFGGVGVTNAINASNITTAINIFGDTESDALTGGASSDTLKGWSGNASKNGSSDTLTGGFGADTLIAGDDTANAYGLSNNATLFINGFDSGSGADMIRITGSSADYAFTAGKSPNTFTLDYKGDVIASLINVSGTPTTTDNLIGSVV